MKSSTPSRTKAKLKGGEREGGNKDSLQPLESLGSPIGSDGVRARIAAQIKSRLYRIGNYISLFVYLIFVYCGFLLTEHVIALVVKWLIADDVARHQSVAAILNYAEIGLALGVITMSLIHGILSFVILLKMDLAIAQEMEKQYEKEQRSAKQPI